MTSPTLAKSRAEVVVDLGRPCRPCSGSTAAPPPLRDGDGRRDAVDPVGVGLVELFEELAGVGREGLDVPPLPLGVERVERQRALARPADARSGRPAGRAAGRGRPP